MTIKQASLLSFVLVLTSAANAQDATKWLLSRDWSPPANPNGAWSYGEYIGGTLTGKVGTPLAGGSFFAENWNKAGNYYGDDADAKGHYTGGVVYKNTTNKAAFGIGTGEISLESDWGTAAVRWTAPTTGTYFFEAQIGGQLGPANGAFGNSFVEYAGVNINGTALAPTSSLMTATSSKQVFRAKDLSLKRGSTIDAYVANPGGITPANGGNTQLRMYVFEVPAPEPAAFIGLGLGVLGLAIRHRKRK
jgi:PEP-CTERM motif